MIWFPAEPPTLVFEKVATLFEEAPSVTFTEPLIAVEVPCVLEKLKVHFPYEGCPEVIIYVPEPGGCEPQKTICNSGFPPEPYTTIPKLPLLLNELWVGFATVVSSTIKLV